MNNHPNQENKHPNNRIRQEDFDKISLQYVLEGEKLTVKSIFEKENIKPRKVPKSQPESDEEESENDKQYKKLEYLEQMGVLNQEEEKVLNEMRRFRQHSFIPSEQRPIKADQGYFPGESYLQPHQMHQQPMQPQQYPFMNKVAYNQPCNCHHSQFSQGYRPYSNEYNPQNHNYY